MSGSSRVRQARRVPCSRISIMTRHVGKEIDGPLPTAKGTDSGSADCYCDSRSGPTEKQQCTCSRSQQLVTGAFTKLDNRLSSALHASE